MKTIALIPARSGSKGLINKNIKLLGEIHLLGYSILAARMTSEIDEVYVSTDSKDYAKIANYYGAKTPFLRPESLSTDTSSDIDFFIHAIDWFKENLNVEPTRIVHLRPTTPLRDPNVISKALKDIEQDVNCTSLRSCHKTPESPFKWFLKDNKDYLKSFNDLSPDASNDPRQGFPDVYIPDGYVDIIKLETLKKNILHGDKVRLFETPVTYEIDNDSDFKFIEYQLEKVGSPILEFYNTVKK
jgi:CMP-N,N'-diacetyllegionaminic acid synthase